MNPITQAVKQKFPQYQNVDDDDLTLAIGQKYPQYLSHPQFASDFQQVKNDAPMKAMLGRQVAYQRAQNTLPVTMGMQDQPHSILGNTLLGMAQDFLSASTTALGAPNPVPPIVNKNPMDAVENAGINLGSMVLNPKSYVIPPAYKTIEGFSPLLAKVGLAALATPTVAQNAGIISPGSGAKPNDKLQAAIEGGAASLGFLPLAFKEPVAKTQMPRTVEEINKFNNHQPRQPQKPIQLGSGQPDKPSPFDKGKLMSNEPTPMDVPAVKKEIASLPTEQLSKSYQAIQPIAKRLMSENRLAEANQLIVRGQFLREELQRRTSESQRTTPAINQTGPVQTPQQAGGVTPPPASLNFKPAVRIAGKVTEGSSHGVLVQKAFMEAQKAGVQKPNVERGFVDQNGKWYATQLDVARAKMGEQQKQTGIKQNENETKQVQETTGLGRSGSGRASEKEIPGNGGQGTGSNGEGGKQREEKTLSKKEQDEEQQRLSEALGDVQELDRYGGESGSVNVAAIKQGLQDLGKGIKEHVEPALKEGKEMLKRVVLRRSGESLPFHARADKELGNTAYLLGQSQGIANRLAEVDPKIVLQGEKEDSEFDKTLGAVWTEAQLRDKRSNLYSQGKDAEARQVETIVGNGRSPIQNETQYNALLRNKRIQEATLDMRRLVGNKAQQRQQNLKGKMSQIPGLGFVNLLVKDEPSRPVAGSGLRGAQLRGSAMNMPRAGTGTSYDVSATRIMQNMIKGKGNYYRSALADYYKEALKKGLGVWVRGGEKPPEGFVQIPQDVTRLIVKDEDGSVNVSTQRKDFYLRKDLYSEFRRLTGLDHSTKDSVADFFTRLQVSAGIDALQHSANVVTAYNGAAQGALGKNIIGAREANTLYQLAKNVGQELQDDPEFLAIAHGMAERGILRDVHSMKGLAQGVPVLGKALNFGGAMIQHLDKAGRMAMYKEAVMLANKGLGKHDVIEIRRQINKQFGQYNPRLMTAWEHIMRSVFSPFNVASKTFNNLAMQRILMSPGFAAANKQAWAKGAARQLAYAATAYFAAPMLINYEKTGQFFPEGVPFGAAVIGKNADGTWKTFDFLKFTFARRGLRITGAGDLYEGQIKPRLEGEKPEALNQNLHEAATDALRGQLAPYVTGPLPAVGSVLLTGKTPLGYDARQKGDTQSPYFAAAARQLNPVSGALSSGALQGDAAQPLVKRLEQTLGVGNSKTPTQIMQNFARQFLFKIGKAKQMDFEPGAESSLVNDLKTGNPDKAKEDYNALLQQKIEQHQFAADPENEAKRDLQRYFTSYAKRPVTGSKETEEAFVKQLTPHQQDLYNQMMQEQEAVSEEFFKLQPPMGKKPRGMSLRF